MATPSTILSVQSLYVAASPLTIPALPPEAADADHYLVIMHFEDAEVGAGLFYGEDNFFAPSNWRPVASTVNQDGSGAVMIRSQLPLPATNQIFFGESPCQAYVLAVGGTSPIGYDDSAFRNSIYTTTFEGVSDEARWTRLNTPGGSYASEALADDPLAYWRLGEASGTSMLDSSGNGFDGAYVGGTPTLGVPGLVEDSDTAATFTGPSGGPRGEAAVTGGTTGAHSVEAVFTTPYSTWLSDDSCRIIAREGLFDLTARWFSTTGSGKVLMLDYRYWTDGGATPVTVQIRSDQSSLPIPAPGRRIHVAVTHDPDEGGNSRINFYANGVLVESRLTTGSDPGAVAPSAVVTVGGKKTGESTPFTLDEVALYEGLLPQARVQAHADVMTSVVSVPPAIKVPAGADGRAGARGAFPVDFLESPYVVVKWKVEDGTAGAPGGSPAPVVTVYQDGGVPMPFVEATIEQPDGYVWSTFRGNGSTENLDVWIDGFHMETAGPHDMYIREIQSTYDTSGLTNDDPAGSVTLDPPVKGFDTDRVILFGGAAAPGVSLTQDRGDATLLASRTGDPALSSSVWTYVLDGDGALAPTVSAPAATPGLSVLVARSIGRSIFELPAGPLGGGGAEATASWRKQVPLPPSLFGGGGVDGTPTWRVETPDLFEARRLLVDLPQTIAVDASLATTEAGEPNISGVTKTFWYQLDTTGLDVEAIRVRVTGVGSTGKVTVYRRSSAYATSEPTFATLTQVATGTDLRVETDDQYAVLFFQVAVTGGTGAALTLSLSDATPPRGAWWYDAVPIDGSYGYERAELLNANVEAGEPLPAGVAATATSWLSWTAPAAGTHLFTLMPTVSAGDVGLAAYTGGAVNGLAPVASAAALASAGVTLSLNAVEGTTYWIQISVEDEDRVRELMWTVPAAPVDPAEVFEYVRVEAYQSDGLTLVSEIPRRRGVTWTESLNQPGVGEFEVPLDDPILSQYPGILGTGRIVKFWLGNNCVHGFRIMDTEDVMVSDGEHAGRWTRLTGPSVQYLLDDFVLHHDEEPRPDSPAERAFSWASRPGEWYDPERWDDQYNSDSQTDPPGQQGRPAKQRAKYGHPKKWPDPNSLWLWVAQDRKRNEGNWKPKRPIKGLKYYRRNFKVDSDGTRVRMFLTSDESALLYVDGDLILRKSSRETGYKSFVKSSVTLSQGMHTVAIFVGKSRPRKGGGSDGVDAFMFSMYEIDEDGSRGDVLARSNDRWKAYFGEGVPGWNRALVLREIWKEAKDRGNTTALALKMGFTGTVDSEGRAWSDEYNQSLQIGMSTLEIQAGLSEAGSFDVWVDPDTLTVQASKRRGTNKSASVALIPGVNLVDWSSRVTDTIKNVFLIQYDGGFTTVEAPGSVAKNGRREAYVELGGVKEAGTARKLMLRVVRGHEGAIRRAGSPDVVSRKTRNRDAGAVLGLHGAYPFLDWNVGDVIAAPNDAGKMVPYRVLSLSGVEDDNGVVTFDPELELIGGDI